jgi:hypothetical protein
MSPHLVVRRRALVPEDVHACPRLTGDAVVDGFGIRARPGAPLVDGTGAVRGRRGA